MRATAVAVVYSSIPSLTRSPSLLAQGELFRSLRTTAYFPLRTIHSSPFQRNRRDDSNSDNHQTDVNSASSDDVETANDGTEEDDSNQKGLTLYQRFKNTYKVYGKILIVVHGICSLFIFSGLSYIAYSGIDVVSLLHYLNISERVITIVDKPGVSLFATAYVLYKLITPFRYFLTLFLTRAAASVLRGWGLLPKIAKQDRLKNIGKEIKDKSLQKAKDHLKKKDG